MGKTNKYQCSQCKQTYSKWQGQCWSCKNWNSIDKASNKSKNNHYLPINEKSDIRYETKIESIDKFFYKGIPQKAFILFGGEPGVGKSTFVTQLVEKLSQKAKTLYFAGEESDHQIKNRFERLKLNKECIQVINTTSLEEIKIKSKKLKGEVIIIDSLQTLRENDLFNTSSSISKLRNIVYDLNEFVSNNNIFCLSICHINKSGSFSGPKTIEHMVDTALIMKKENNHRKVVITKNRFGEADVIANFSMTKSGLVPIIENKINFSNCNFLLQGVCFGLDYKNNEYQIIETQCVALNKSFKTPKHIIKGFNKSKFNILLAMIESQIKIPLYDHDIFCDVLGNEKNFENCELTLVASILGAVLDKSYKNKYLFVGIVDLTSKIRIDKKVEAFIDKLIIDNDIQIVTSYMYNGSNKNVIKLKFANELTSLLSGEVNEQNAS